MPDSPQHDALGDPAFEARVLRAFIKGDRLASLPARDRKKQVVLRFLVDRVLPDDTEVQEPEMNRRLAAWHPDVAALRRYLVVAGYATRTGMAYRRARPSPAEAPALDRTGPPFV
ncbi:MAG TPA: DUF2087 domain-containing protein [Candidatus Limnocylindrales bacterium]